MVSEHRSAKNLWQVEPQVIVGWVVLAAVFVVTYWSRILWVFDYGRSPDYQHCFFVPAFAVALLWFRRNTLEKDFPSGFSYWSIPCFVLWVVMRGFHAHFYYPTLDGLSVLPFLTGLTLALGGRRGFRWAWPSLVFLLFMFPMPGPVQDFLRYPLQRFATIISVFLIQTLGIPAVAEGNAIHLSETSLEVANVCSGLRMIMVFMAICVGAAFVVKGPLWEKLVIVGSAVPIAIVANVGRITATAVQREYFSSPVLDEEFHDLAGLAMPPLAIMLAWVEITLLRKLFPAEGLESPLMVQVGAAGPKRSRPARPPHR